MTPTEQKNTKFKKKAQILAQAVRLFNERGFNDTRLEDIASELGKVKTSISYHFQSKEALIQEAFSQSSAFTFEELEQAALQSNGLESILYLVRSRAELHAKALAGQIPPVILVSDIEMISQISLPALNEQFKAQIERISAFIREGINDSSIDVRSPEASTFFLINILHWLPEWLANIPNARHMSAIDNICDLMRHGIAFDRQRIPARSILRSQSEDYPAIFDRNVRNQLKRDAFLRTGTRFLNKTGYRNLSLNDVAQELGVTRGAFYYYIADKDALLESCFERTCETMEKSLENAKSSSQHDRLAVVEQCIRVLFEGHITDHNPLLRMNLLNALNPTKRIAIEARFNSIRASFSEILANAMVERSIRTINLDAIENLLMGSIFAANQWRLSATPLKLSWNPTLEPVSASAAYFEPLMTGFSKK